MTLKQLMLVVILATIFCWAIWGMVIFQVDPSTSDLPGFFLFYFSLFFSLLGTAFLVSFGVRKAFNKLDMDYKLVGVSFRQSCFFALTGIGVLFLQSKDLLTWWNILLLIVGLGILELFFLSYRKNNI